MYLIYFDTGRANPCYTVVVVIFGAQVKDKKSFSHDIWARQKFFSGLAID